MLAAMAAFLTKTQRREGLPWLHGGWIIALLLGAPTWVVSSKYQHQRSTTRSD